MLVRLFARRSNTRAFFSSGSPHPPWPCVLLLEGRRRRCLSLNPHPKTGLGHAKTYFTLAGFSSTCICALHLHIAHVSLHLDLHQNNNLVNLGHYVDDSFTHLVRTTSGGLFRIQGCGS